MRKAVLLTSTASAAALMMSAALAEDEIIVTATKREQTLQEVPVAVSVVQEETLERAQIVDVIDLQSVVPALRVSQLERSSNATFIIRGFGNGSNNAGIEPSVAVFVDGVFRTRVGSALDDFINLERIEVLKGPQSTLFGKNASAGVVSVVTKKPSFEWQGAVEGTLGNFNSRIAKGYVTGPINDMFAFSLSGSINKRDGYFENLGDSGDFNNRDRYSLRGQILAQPTEDLEFRVIADYSEIDERCCGTFRQTDGTGPIIRDSLGALTPEPGAFDYTIANDFENRNEISNQGISVQADWDINDDNKLTYISSFRRYDDLVDFEGDFTTATILGTNIRSIDTDTITQELRLAGQKDRISYLVGGFYFYEDLDVGDTVLYGSDARPYVDNVAALLAGFVGPDGTPIAAASPLNTVEALLGLPVGQTFYQDGAGVGFNATQKDQQFQIFAQADFEITDRLTFTAGVAYFQADKEVTFRDIERSN
ncbi:MAG: TonB-dependent receptor plug domain-containing protein, partial [Planctomycetota bacterium]